MDFCRKVSVSGGLQSEFQPEQVLSPSCSKLGSLDDLFSGHCTEADVNLEWLSVFVEDCLSSTGNCVPLATAALPKNLEKTATPITKTVPKPSTRKSLTSSPLQKFVIPCKARSKRKRGPLVKSKSSSFMTSWSRSHQYFNHPQDQTFQMTFSDPPLLQQSHWLADSELINVPKKEDTGAISSWRGTGESGDYEQEEAEVEETAGNAVVGGKRNIKEDIALEEEEEGGGGGGGGQQPRRCTHCLSQRTPQWRAGPLGPKTLCNACGVRYKSGRLLPEYRPAKSPTFVSYKHSNSHKKVLEMRMSLLSSNS
ncbi:hypothetical protein RJ640_029266 [Escallonia rubra]|uniref:GATA-type domain-containing protein n=1 Tax=Escallonia rubra TaxID=112253 RepID=A0AA88QSD6_9ASTE|nr:hypothetical protein RJ640_029266 [Escallonia rubra]